MPIEREYKSIIPDAAAFHKLLELRMLDDWHFEPLPTISIEDRYVDTVDRQLWRHGYACRVRRVADTALLSVKGLGEAHAGYHAREEVESPFSGDLDQGVPDNPAGMLVRRYVSEAPLLSLFTLAQVRHPRRVLSGATVMAEFSCDDVRLALPNGETRELHVAELECVGTCDVDSLSAIHRALVQAYGLSPTDETKFHWAVRQLSG